MIIIFPIDLWVIDLFLILTYKWFRPYCNSCFKILTSLFAECILDCFTHEKEILCSKKNAILKITISRSNKNKSFGKSPKYTYICVYILPKKIQCVLINWKIVHFKALKQRSYCKYCFWKTFSLSWTFSSQNRQVIMPLSPN